MCPIRKIIQVLPRKAPVPAKLCLDSLSLDISSHTVRNISEIAGNAGKWLSNICRSTLEELETIIEI
jgi:hypothetical protein